MSSFEAHHGRERRKKKHEHRHRSQEYDSDQDFDRELKRNRKHKHKHKHRHKQEQKHEEHREVPEAATATDTKLPGSQPDKSTVFNEVVDILQQFQIRINATQLQIDAFESARKRSCKPLRTAPTKDKQAAALIKKSEAFEELIDLAIGHFTETFIQSRALRDELQESSVNTLARLQAVLDKYTQHLADVVREYDRRQRDLLRGLSAAALERTEAEMAKRRTIGSACG